MAVILVLLQLVISAAHKEQRRIEESIIKEPIL
jgi:hypothetical protein